MKRFFLSLYIATLLAGCAGGTTDPAIGKADLQKVSHWEQSADIAEGVAQALTKANPQTHESFSQVINNAVKQSVEKERQRLMALNVQHQDVRKLVKLYEEKLMAMPAMYQTLLSGNEKARIIVQNKLDRLTQQTAQLEQQLKKQLLQKSR